VLAPALLNIILGHLCPFCGAYEAQRGSFFSAATNYMCVACAKRVP
jgi:hypothetical protein